MICSFHNSFKSGFNASINAMETKALDNASKYFPKENVSVLGDLAGLVARMFHRASDERGKEGGRRDRESCVLRVREKLAVSIIVLI